MLSDPEPIPQAATDERRYWYFISEVYCPVCARTRTTRTRMDTPRPDDWDDRHELIEFYDYCNG